MSKSARVLVIKLGALGDFIQAFGPFQAIRYHHPKARLILLTTLPFKQLAIESGLFDKVWIDSKPKIWEINTWLSLRDKLRGEKFYRIYDLQTSNRSSLYFKLLLPGMRPEWSGIAAGCSHPHSNKKRDLMHTVERQAEQLSLAGITTVPPSDLSWVKVNISHFKLPKNYAIIVPGGAVHRPEKRWPAQYFAKLINAINQKGFCSVIVGSRSDGDTLTKILEDGPKTINLCGKTSLSELCVLARTASFSVGNDTGPMHIAATTGKLSLVLFSDKSNPQLCVPRGPQVRVLQKTRLADISVSEVLTELKSVIGFK